MEINDIIVNTIVAFICTVVTSIFAYIVGRKRNVAEVEVLKAEKTVLEARAAGLMAEAAAEMVGPLLERIRALQEDVAFLTEQNIQFKDKIEELEMIIREATHVQ